MSKPVLGLYREQSGMILPAMIFIIMILSISLLAIANFTTHQLRRSTENISATNALLVAEAGAEASLYELNQNNGFAGYASEQTFFDNSVKGRATYQTDITNGSVGNEKIITATGRVYLPAASATPLKTRQVRLTVVGTTTGDFSVQTGPGGLIMNNSATVANGEVYVNGTITMSNSARIGSATAPVNVSAAHNSCPAGGGSGYPTQCTSGQPITLNNTAHIYGNVCATNQTSGNGMSNSGLQAGCSAPAVSLPSYDRQAHIDAVTNTMSGSQASCSGIQAKTWPANTHITGDVTISNICLVTIMGNVWIDGRLRLNNVGALRVHSSVASTPTIMVDGASVELNNASIILPNSSGKTPQFITYRSAATCSPNCADVTGTDLYNSQSLATIKLNNASLAAGAIFYARWSKVELTNAGSVGALAGQTIQLNNAGNITFGTNLSSGQSIWSIKNYQQVFN